MIESNSVKIVVPVNVTDSILESINVPESEADVTLWSAVTAYAEKNKVYRTETHFVYERIVAGTTSELPEDDPDNWLELYKTNPLRLFDDQNSSITTNPDFIEFFLKPGTIVNSIYLANVIAQEVEIEVIDPVAGIVMPTTVFAMKKGSPSSGWYSYLWGGNEIKTDLFAQLPPYSKASIRVKITNVGGIAEAGTCLIGKAIEYGEGIQLGANLGIQDYSVKEPDDYGGFKVVKRSNAKTSSFTIWLPNDQVDSINSTLAKLTTIPTLYVATTKYTSAIVYGFYRKYNIALQYDDASLVNIDILGLT